MTPFDLLARYPDRSRPLVTHYAGSQARVELSVASTLNAVAKAASLLRDGLGLAPGCVVSVDLPRHWQLPVWVMAALSVGARVGRGEPGEVDVRIVGPSALAGIAAGGDPRADEVLVSSCDAFGMPVPGGVPSGVVDIGLEVRGYPDSFTPEPDASGARVLAGGEPVRWDEPTAGRAGQPQRWWIDEATPDSDLVPLVVQALLAGGSLVIGVDLGVEEAATIRRVESAVVPS